MDYIAALRKQLMDDSRHWELVLEPRIHVIAECRDLHLELQKVLGKRVCQANSWNDNSLPHMYNTFKSKCLDTSPLDSGRTCQKQGHSCLRKIISWVQHPGPCKRCGANMEDYTMVIVDAAQFYEDVSQDEIVKALKNVVTAFPEKRLRGFASA